MYFDKVFIFILRIIIYFIYLIYIPHITVSLHQIKNYLFLYLTEIYSYLILVDLQVNLMEQMLLNVFLSYQNYQNFSDLVNHLYLSLYHLIQKLFYKSLFLIFLILYHVNYLNILMRQTLLRQRLSFLAIYFSK